MPIKTLHIAGQRGHCKVTVDQRWISLVVFENLAEGPTEFPDDLIYKTISPQIPRLQQKMHWHTEQHGSLVFRHCTLPPPWYPGPFLYVGVCRDPDGAAVPMVVGYANGHDMDRVQAMVVRELLKQPPGDRWGMILGCYRDNGGTVRTYNLVNCEHPDPLQWRWELDDEAEGT